VIRRGYFLNNKSAIHPKFACILAERAQANQDKRIGPTCGKVGFAIDVGGTGARRKSLFASRGNFVFELAAGGGCVFSLAYG